MWIWTIAAVMLGAELDRLTDDRQELLFAPQGLSLTRLLDKSLAYDHLAGAGTSPALWQIDVRTAGQTTSLSPGDAGRFHAQSVTEPQFGLRLAWSGFAASANVSEVIVTVWLEADRPASRWAIEVKKSAASELEKIRFPRVGSFRPQPEERLAVPTWTGRLCDTPRALLAGEKQAGRRVEWSYPGELSLQCAAWYREGGPGLYLACNDTAAHRKTLAFWGAPNELAHGELVHLPEGQAAAVEHYQLPYQVLLESFAGDWFTAAERYRAWGLEQAWSRNSRLRLGRVPEWVVQTGAWVWNRGRSEGVLPPALALQQEIGLPVQVFWHWWHGCAYDIGFPEYLPPREGADEFRTAVMNARHAGSHAMVYMNQRLWGMSTRSWTDEGAAEFAVKGPDGAIRPEVYNVFDPQPCAAMCIGTSFWRDKYAGLAEQAIGLGVEAIYMDQACLSLACYDPTHGHRVGGGTYWIDGFRQLAQDIRRRAGADRQIALAGEGCGEAWLDSLDLMLALQVSQERYETPGSRWEVIPFFQAVYHGDAVLFGSYSSLTMPPYDEFWPREFAPEQPLALLDRKFSGQFYLEQARAFVWGQQPTLANFGPRQLEERAAEMDYFKRLVRTRQQALKYLLHGRFLRPPDLDAPRSAVDFSRVSIYAGRRGGQTAQQKRCPLVLAGAWQAPDQQVGIAIASIAQEPLSVRLRLDAREHSLADTSGVDCITDAGRQPLGQLTAHNPELRLELPPLAVWFLELQPR